MAKPTPNPPLFTVNPHQNTEALLVKARNAMTCNLAFNLDTSQRAIMLGIQQMAEWVSCWSIERWNKSARHRKVEAVPKRD
jgi:hypothetical protein